MPDPLHTYDTRLTHSPTETPVDMTTAYRIRRYGYTDEEVQTATEALRYFRAAAETEARRTYDGSQRYKGRTAWDVVTERITDPKRQRLVLSLALTMWREAEGTLGGGGGG